MANVKRLLTVAGMGIIAGATLAAGPVQAAADTSQSSTTKSATTQQARWGSNQIVGYYSNFWSCQQAGAVGSRFGAWGDFACQQVALGIRTGAFALIVDDNDWIGDWNDSWSVGYWPTGWGYRPQWPGHHWGGPRGHWGPRGHFDGPRGHFGGPRGFEHH